MIQAILFDMDGTLADTENLDQEVANEMAKSLGIKLTQEDKLQRQGRTTKSFYEYLAREKNLHFNFEKILKEHEDWFGKKLSQGVESFSGTKELLQECKANNFKLGLVSGSTKDQIELVLKNLSISKFFEVIVSADDTEESKPNPAGYLKAAQLLQVSPQECVVVEDSKNGVEAGKNANMKVIGVINNGGQDLSKADSIVQNPKEITLELIKSISYTP